MLMERRWRSGQKIDKQSIGMIIGATALIFFLLNLRHYFSQTWM